MDATGEYLKLFFFEAKPERIELQYLLKDGALRYDSVPRELFVNYANACFANKSENELYQYYSDFCRCKSNGEKKTVFDYLVRFGEKTITMQNDIPVAKFEHILEWRDVTHKIDQTNVIAAYLAKMSITHNYVQTFFGWPTVLSSDNRLLQNILNNGLAENHYHLHGSTQVFPITWVGMMNHPEQIEVKSKVFRENLMPAFSYGDKDNRTVWKELLLEAAKIRFNLFCKINQQYSSLTMNNRVVFLQELVSSISAVRFNEKIKSRSNSFVLDYAVTRELAHDHCDSLKLSLLGERKLLYDCFLFSFLHYFTDVENNMLYKYILIKNNFRAELVQCNGRLGFKNFANYQWRKTFFIKGMKRYEEEALNLSLNDVLTNGHIHSLEARIMVEKHTRELFENIRMYDRVYRQKSNEDCNKNRQPPYFFVVHYPKGTTPLKRISFAPKNARQRNRNKFFSKAAIHAMSKMRWRNNRIFGIDTCSNEIGCRPEVFATEYRFMQQYSYTLSSKHSIYKCDPLFIGRTYHVGEDFLDLTDGLRAIDEVLYYLEFSHGDRLGHALALGINPKAYYDLKNYSVILPKQDLLDNLVWAYCKANEMNILIAPGLQQKMLALIHTYAFDIYGEFMCDMKDFSRFNVSDIYLNPETLYAAWKLRGDHPCLYENIQFPKNPMLLCAYERAMISQREELQILRKEDTMCLLNFAYHFNYKSKAAGEELTEYCIMPEYVFLVEALQKVMQFTVANKDIMIECNPSSNCLIGTFRSYDKHPISSFNNLELTNDLTEIEKCPQICVSINTDDQGIFDTSLEYEYALIAAGLLERKKQDGSPKYTHAQVYRYLDSVRKMSNTQSFRDNSLQGNTK